ncbi:MAG TPA: peptide deformylase [Gemmatimonadaceae bacterium]|nr:peptide deformylase [Gemmatimonadaceae bacterium]
MAVLDIRVLGDPILRERTDPLRAVTDEVRALVADMFETMRAAEGIGLAAPQVGRKERVFVMEVDDDPMAMVNPEIIEREGSERAEEGCLSIPEIFGDVDRATRIVVRALDADGNPFEVELTDLAARCVQHELDHLDGKLFIDYMSLIKRKFTARKWEKEAVNYPGFIRKLEPGKAHSRKSRSRNKSTDPAAPPFEPEL